MSTNLNARDIQLCKRMFKTRTTKYTWICLIIYVCVCASVLTKMRKIRQCIPMLCMVQLRASSGGTQQKTTATTFAVARRHPHWPARRRPSCHSSGASGQNDVAGSHPLKATPTASKKEMLLVPSLGTNIANSWPSNELSGCSALLDGE